MEAPGALGSDTGGSIRQPAAFCGVVGLKPTYGRVSRYGLVAFASSLDQIGPLANSARDAARILQVTAGHDPCDATSATRPVDDYLSGIEDEVRGLKIGMPVEWFGSGLDPQLDAGIRSAIAGLEKLGCQVQEVHLPHTEFAIAAYYIIAPAEASSNLARYDGMRYGYRSADQEGLQGTYRSTRSKGFGEEVKRRIMIGTYVLSSGYYDAYYLKASKVRTLLKQDYLKAFERVDLLIGPTAPSLPFKLGENADPLEMYLSDIYTVPANLVGIPGLAMGCGFTQEGLPLGLQILGPHFQEARILQAAHALEQIASGCGPAPAHRGRKKLKYRVLGTTGMMVSPICMGTMTFGRPLDEEQSKDLVGYALDRGINFFDTANVYEGYDRKVGSSGGVSERLLGQGPRGAPTRRRDLYQAGKPERHRAPQCRVVGESSGT